MPRSASAPRVARSPGGSGHPSVVRDGKFPKDSKKDDVKQFVETRGRSANMRSRSSPCAPRGNSTTRYTAPSVGQSESSPTSHQLLGESTLVLTTILKAQNMGLSKLGKDGKFKQMCPPFSTACEEIRQGSKRSHWIWYVWPSLSAVRGSMRPEMLLPDFKAVCAYLQHRVLADRLLQVSSLAYEHLEHGVNPSVLFGKMHHCDFPKFYEAMSMFALAAQLNGNMKQRDAFLRGVRACGKDCLDEQVVNTLVEENLPESQRAITYISQILSGSELQFSTNGSCTQLQADGRNEM